MSGDRLRRGFALGTPVGESGVSRQLSSLIKPAWGPVMREPRAETVRARLPGQEAP